MLSFEKSWPSVSQLINSKILFSSCLRVQRFPFEKRHFATLALFYVNKFGLGLNETSLGVLFFFCFWEGERGTP